MRFGQTLTATVGNGYWIVLEQDFGGYWTLLVWGSHPLREKLGWVSEEEAKRQSLAAAKRHLEQLGFTGELPDVLWRVAIRQMVA